ncbi:MAG: phosphonate ABC transporter, permease protein PhnE [Bacilli bacterium]|nr:phosphonate ABC transporter, permease protein PhnE [Bacilli bacterium]MDD3422495.1 phosphonate ABC transporter, permease protein PhnE [Bacilli bacterium]MDD4065542.1 phosphonate ABC transporter, permease protein PhnE [Bacilli bacterium]
MFKNKEQHQIKKQVTQLNDSMHVSKDVSDKYNQRPKKWIYNMVITVIIIFAVIWTFFSSGITIRNVDFATQFYYLWRGFTHPNTSFLFDWSKGGVPYLTLETVAIAFSGTFLAAVLAIPFGFLTAKNVVGKHISKIGELLLIIIRTFPEIVLALVLIRVVGMGATTGALTIGIHSIGMLAKLYAEAIENMDPGPIEALDAVGANIWQKIKYGIFPQVIPDFLSVALYRFDINVRSATILGMVSAGGLGAPLIFASQSWNWSNMSAVLIAIIIMVIIVDAISSKLRSKLI